MLNRGIWTLGFCSIGFWKRGSSPGKLLWMEASTFCLLPVNSRAALQRLELCGWRVGPCRPSQEAVIQVHLVRPLINMHSDTEAGLDTSHVVSVTPRRTARTCTASTPSPLH